MDLTQFTPAGQDPARPSGPAELGGIPVHVFLDRSDPAWITIRSSMAEGAPLVPRLQAVAEISVNGAAVTVRPVTLPGGAGALRGRIDPALVEALTGPLPDPAPEPRPEPGPAAPAGEPGPDPLVDLSRQLSAARAEARAHAERGERLRAEKADLRLRIEAIDAGLAADADADAAHVERCADLRQRMRDLLDAEEA